MCPGGCGLLSHYALRSGGGFVGRWLQANASAARQAFGILGDEFNAGYVQRLDDLCQRTHDASNITLAGFHPLYGRNGDARALGKRSLINAKHDPGGTQLCGCDHKLDPVTIMSMLV